MADLPGNGMLTDSKSSMSEDYIKYWIVKKPKSRSKKQFEGNHDKALEKPSRTMFNNGEKVVFGRRSKKS